MADNGLFPKAGVKCSYLLTTFVNDICGGDREKLIGWTTARVCEEHVKRATAADHSSYCNLLKKRQQQQHCDAYSEKANIFISHAHSYMFLDVLSALEWHLRDEYDTAVIWFDLFSINQHETSLWSFDWLCETFQSAIGEIGRVIMIMSPWYNPLPFTRAWCVFEAYCAAVADNCRFEIALSQTDQKEFLAEIKINAVEPINKMLATIRSENSRCSNCDDERNIFSVIQKTIGFSKLDSMVFECYRDWIIEIVSTTLNDCKEGSADYVSLLGTIGIIYRGQGKFTMAVSYLQSHLEYSHRLFGEDSKEVLSSTRELAELYREIGDFEQSRSLHRLCFEKRNELLGSDDVATLQSMNDLAKVLGDSGFYEDSQTLYESCLNQQKLILGEDHPDTLMTLSHLGMLYHHQREMDLGRKLLVQSVEKRSEVLGPEHPLTLISMKNLAGHHLARGRHDLARPLYKMILEKQRKVLGSDHPNTLVTMSNLASLYRRQEQHEESQTLYREWLEKTWLVFGDENSETLNSISGIANYFYEQGNVEEARQLWSICLEKQKMILGDKHEETQMTKKLLYM